jgi:hypothetical protein
MQKLWLVLSVFVVIGLACNTAPASKRAEPAPDKLLDVTYSVESRIDFDTTYSTPNGTEQDEGFKTWQKSFKVKPGSFLYVSAQNGDDSPKAEITCKITVNGSELKSSTSQGAYKIATCEGKAE